MDSQTLATINSVINTMAYVVLSFSIVLLHPIALVRRLQKTEKKTDVKSRDRAIKGKSGKRITSREVYLWFIQMLLVDIIVALWFLPSLLRWLGADWAFIPWIETHLGMLRWIGLYTIVGILGYALSKKHGERRGLYSGFGHLSVILIGWLLYEWIGILSISLPIILLYYYLLYCYSSAIIPISNPDIKLALFDKTNDKWNRFLVLVWYTWGIQFPVYVITDQAGREIETRIPGNPYRSLGRPGIIWSKTHQVVGITKGTEFSFVGEPGVIFTEPFEKPMDVVDLRPQIRTSKIDTVTKDGFQFIADLFMEFRVNDSGSDFKEGIYPYSTKWVRRLLTLASVEATDPDDHPGRVIHWDERIVKHIEEAARQILSQRTADELWISKNNKYKNAYEDIGEEIKSKIQNRLLEHGILLSTVRMESFHFSKEKDEEISKKQLSTWQSFWDNRFAVKYTDSDTESERLQEEARIDMRVSILSSVAKLFGENSNRNSPEILSCHFINALEEMIKEQPEIIENLEQADRACLSDIRQRLEIRS